VPGCASSSSPNTNNLDAKPFEGERDGVLILVETEISTTAGHLGCLSIPDPIFRLSGDALDALHDVRSLGGVAFAAHPLNPRADFRWTGWELPGPWGIELMIGDSQWRSAGSLRLLPTEAALYHLEGSTLFQPGADDRSRVLLPLLDPRAGEARSGGSPRSARRPNGRGWPSHSTACDPSTLTPTFGWTSTRSVRSSSSSIAARTSPEQKGPFGSTSLASIRKDR
jgi:hypothetical protein